MIVILFRLKLISVDTCFSNTAAESITNLTLHHWQTGLERTDIKLKEMEDIISTVSINSKTSKYLFLYYNLHKRKLH